MGDQEGRAALDLASAACTASFAAALAGIAPLSSTETRAAQPASNTSVKLRLRSLSFFSTPVVVGSAPAGGGGATRAARPSSPNRLKLRLSFSSAGRCRKAGARATSPASPMSALLRVRLLSRDRAPRPRAAASAKAPALPTCTLAKVREVTAGSAPAASPSASRCTPSGPAAPAEFSMMVSAASAGSTEPSLPSVARSTEKRPLLSQKTSFASRSSLQLIPVLRHSAAADSYSVLSCCRSAGISARSS
eukprot:scaffold19576_cov57-Phaeocystis_antarctica.AAC.2